MYPIHEEQDSAFYDLQLATQVFEFIFRISVLSMVVFKRYNFTF